MPRNSASGELLGEMYRNVAMSSENLVSSVPKITEKAMLTDVTAQLEGYAHLTQRTEQLMKERSVTPQKPSKLEKLMAKGNIMKNTLFDSSDSRIADIIITEAQTNADALEDSLTAHDKADSSVRSLCREIVDFERIQADKMREFL